MTNPPSSLAQLLRRANDEPALVRERRTSLLAARGLLEMLLQKAVQANERLARGRYHLTFKSDIPSKGVLAPIARAELVEATDALREAIPLVVEAIQQMRSLDVATAIPELIDAELDNCQRRVDAAEALLRDWSKAITN